ncbi:MAG: hypothetical protein ACFCGT_07830 [Sandaracinaceae bacterium]
MARLAILPVALLVACHTSPPVGSHAQGRAGSPRASARRSLAPAQAAVQPAGPSEDSEAGFDVRLVRVQPGIHLRSVQPCDAVFAGRPEAVGAEQAATYPLEVAYRLAIKCRALTGEGWADLVVPPELADRVNEVRRGRRLRVRLLSADGGYFDYPIVALASLEPEAPSPPAPRAEPARVEPAFDLRRLADDPALLGTEQVCAVTYAADIDVVGIDDQRRHSYPTGIQNRMTVRCRHAGGEEPADLVFMPAQALAALTVRRGSRVRVRVISRHGGFVDYPILQFAGS